MATEKQKFDYLDEHLPYMLSSVLYDFHRLTQPLFFRDWNAYFQSFSVNARNLAEFLTNGDKGNFRACDFISGFRNRKGDIQGPMRKLDEQDFHLGKSRPRDKEGKFDLAAAREVLDWIEQGMNDFVDNLSTEDRKIWNPKKADPAFDNERSPSTGPTGPTSTSSASSSILVSTTHTSSVAQNLDLVPDALKKGKKQA